MSRALFGEKIGKEHREVVLLPVFARGVYPFRNGIENNLHHLALLQREE